MYVQVMRALHRTKMFQRARRVILSNNYDIYNKRVKPNVVNLEYSHNRNLGDSLSRVVVEWMLEKEGLSLDSFVSSIKHLMAIGSIVSRGSFDATVWGTGVLNCGSLETLKAQHNVRRLDVRAVRGPNTRDALLNAGFDCPALYGDPAILLPLINPVDVKCERKHVGLVLHHATCIDTDVLSAISGLKKISIDTFDYKCFVNEIISCKSIISSSLHGIIIAESYGIPAIYLWEPSDVGEQGIKFKDWYDSTGRFDIVPARSIEEAMTMNPPEVPQLRGLREGIISCFPYDLWND